MFSFKLLILYVSRFWRLVKLTFKEQQNHPPRALSHKVVSETKALKNFTEWSDTMSDFCVVPTAADAADVRGFNVGDRVFSVSPPLWWARRWRQTGKLPK